MPKVQKRASMIHKSYLRSLATFSQIQKRLLSIGTSHSIARLMSPLDTYDANTQRSTVADPDFRIVYKLMKSVHFDPFTDKYSLLDKTFFLSCEIF